MSWVAHHLIAVTSFNSYRAETARTKAIEIFGLEQITHILISPVNAYYTFAVFPDGSKEGWEDSNVGDANRDAFIAWLNSCRYEGGSSPYEWVEVVYGNDIKIVCTRRTSAGDRLIDVI